MKKKTAVFASFILAGSLIATMCGCSIFDRAEDGSFPYTGAVAGGYTGTEAAYLAEQDTPSTYERQLYADAVAGGYTRTYH